MEWWFIFAVASAVFSGFHTFAHKVAVEKNHDAALVTGISTLLSGLVALSIAVYIGDFSHFMIILLLSGVGGMIHQAGTLVRISGMRFIDTTIFFPLYKVLSPLVAVVAGIVWFGEYFSVYEWIGIIFGVLVPLLLISRSEKHRQNNLVKGLWFVVGSSVLVAVSAAINKEATNIITHVFLFGAFANLFASVFSMGLFWYTHRTVNIREKITTEIQTGGIRNGLYTGVLQFFAFMSFLLAFDLGGTLGVVYTINSLYILIPIVLSIIIYNEHWNARKVIAIVLSIAALGLLR